MRVLIFNWRDIKNPRAGGAEIYTHEIARRLVDRGHEVTWFTSAYPGSSSEEIIDNMRFVRAGGRIGVYLQARRYYRRMFAGQIDVVVDEINTRPFMTPKYVKEPIVALIHQLAREFWFYETPLPVNVLGRYWLEDRWPFKVENGSLLSEAATLEELEWVIERQTWYYTPSAGTRGLATERLWRTLGIYPRVLVETGPRSGSVLGAQIQPTGTRVTEEERRMDRGAADGQAMQAEADPAAVKLALVSPYPLRGEKHVSSGGVPAYSKNLACALVEAGVQVTVLAEKRGATVSPYMDEVGVRVVPCWTKGPLYAFQILRCLWGRRREVDLVHVQHEYFLFGGALEAAVFPLLVALSRVFLRRPVIVTLHGVIPLSMIDPVFLHKNGLRGPVRLFRFTLRVITKLTGLVSSRVVVHEEKFGSVLRADYGIDSQRICVIPHGVEQRTDLVSREQARRKLNVREKRVLLFFGYLSGYKGLHALVEAYGHLDEKDRYLLIVAGGEHPRYQDDPVYKRSIADLKEKAQTISRDIRFTGFVPEEEIPLYFAAADLVVLPYTQVIASSGPLSLAIAYEKPVLVSSEMSRTLGRDLLSAEPRPPDLAQAVMRFFADETLRGELARTMAELRQERSWRRVGEKTVALYVSVLGPSLGSREARCR